MHSGTINHASSSTSSSHPKLAYIDVCGSFEWGESASACRSSIGVLEALLVDKTCIGVASMTGCSALSNGFVVRFLVGVS